MDKSLLTQRVLIAVVALVALCGISVIILKSAQELKPTPTQAVEQNQQGQQALPSTAPAATLAQQADFVRLAWFYKPVENGQTNVVAQNFDFYILTYKDEQERDALKTMGVSALFSQYLLFLTIEDPGDCTEEPRGNQVAFKEGDFCQISEQHPDWFLLDQNGQRIKSGSSSYHMDPGSEGFRQFWLERARELQETFGWDNVFLDNVEASRVKMVKDGGGLSKYPDDKSYQLAVEGFLDYIRQNYFQPRGKLVYGNIISQNDDQVWYSYLQHLDGAMIESFATDWSDGYRSRDEWEQQMEEAERALAQGKTMILVAQGDKDDLDLQNFAFASYLLINDGNAVFRYTNADSYRELWLYENYNINIGTPLGNRYQDQGGWRRDFSNGYVIVNPQKETAEIVVNQ